MFVNSQATIFHKTIQNIESTQVSLILNKFVL